MAAITSFLGQQGSLTKSFFFWTKFYSGSWTFYSIWALACKIKFIKEPCSGNLKNAILSIADHSGSEQILHPLSSPRVTLDHFGLSSGRLFLTQSSPYSECLSFTVSTQEAYAWPLSINFHELCCVWKWAKFYAMVFLLLFSVLNQSGFFCFNHCLALGFHQELHKGKQKCFMGNALVRLGYWNKVPETGWLWTSEMYSL